MITSREEVTRRIVAAKVQNNLKWSDVAKALGQSKEWTTAACLGQMQLTKEEATQIGKLFELDDEVTRILELILLDFSASPGSRLFPPRALQTFRPILFSIVFMK